MEIPDSTHSNSYTCWLKTAVCTGLVTTLACEIFKHLLPVMNSPFRKPLIATQLTSAVTAVALLVWIKCTDSKSEIPDPQEEILSAREQVRAVAREQRLPSIPIDSPFSMSLTVNCGLAQYGIDLSSNTLGVYNEAIEELERQLTPLACYAAHLPPNKEELENEIILLELLAAHVLLARLACEHEGNADQMAQQLACRAETDRPWKFDHQFVFQGPFREYHEIRDTRSTALFYEPYTAEWHMRKAFNHLCKTCHSLKEPLSQHCVAMTKWIEPDHSEYDFLLFPDQLLKGVVVQNRHPAGY